MYKWEPGHDSAYNSLEQRSRSVNVEVTCQVCLEGAVGDASAAGETSLIKPGDHSSETRKQALRGLRG